MPLFGAPMSIAGGCEKALLAAQAHQCATVQLFTKILHTVTTALPPLAFTKHGLECRYSQ